MNPAVAAVLAMIFGMFRHSLTIFGPLLATQGIDVAEVAPALDGLEQGLGWTITALGLLWSLWNAWRNNRRTG